VGLRQGFEKVSLEEVHLEKAVGRILAQDIYASENLPGFARSTVDGLRRAGRFHLRRQRIEPCAFQPGRRDRHGRSPRMSVAPGQAVRISTGGMLSPGADSVVMLEHSESLDDTTIEVFRSVAPGQHIIAANEDFQNGALIVAAGRRLRPQDVGLLAAFGRTRMCVFRQPVVGILSTGDEIVPAEDLPGPAQIRDVNRYTLAGLVSQAGAVPVTFGSSATNSKSSAPSVKGLWRNATWC